MAFAILLACLIWTRRPANPFAEGAIPAAARQPSEHWEAILHWPDLHSGYSFTRHLTSYARAPPKAAWWRGGKRSLTEELEGVDYGGEDGHEPEVYDPDDQKVGGAESLAATRCSSTRFAVTAYYCGLEVAHNLDRREGASSVGDRIGHQEVGDAAILSLANWLREMHMAAEVAGTPHKRLVYRLGVSSEDGKAGYAHVWNIVAQPDGSFHWLQSFINHYSLPAWLRQSDARSERHLPLETLLHKLELLGQLTRISRWDAFANDAYLRLFNVDMDRARRVDTRETIARQRLQHFSWDVACEYPTPDGPGTDLGLIMADRDRHAAAIWSAFAASHAARHQGEGVEDDE